MIQLSHISKSYHVGGQTLTVLKDVSLKIEDGDFVAIMGPSGSGKSTLMHILGLLDVPSAGSYQFNGREVSGLSEDELAVLRREEIGFIFQQFHLLPRLQAMENVALPHLYSATKMDLDMAKNLLARVGLAERFTHRPNELSGGQQQRVAIARSLINHPYMILADEPTGNLDSKSEKEIMAILKELNAQGITVVIVTHEEEIGSQAKRLIRMRDGEVLSDERTEALPSSSPRPPAPLHLRKGDSWAWGELQEHFKQGYKTLVANKVRSALSMLGILIGVAAVVTMLALGRGAQKAIEAQLSSLGSNVLNLSPGAIKVGGASQAAGDATRLTIEDAMAIQNSIPGVKSVSPQISGGVQITYEDKNWATSLKGTGASYAKIHSLIPEQGRFFTDDENQQRRRVAVLGMTVVKNIFGDKDPLGEMIKINKVTFQVIGILPPKGGSGWFDQDDVVVIPVITAMRRVLGKSYIYSIEIEVNHPENADSIQDSITALMGTRHRIPEDQKDDAFQIRNMADIQEALAQSSKTMSTLLAAIAAISLVVGGIGIMNIMLVSVTERTKEIGLRKAVGAKRRDILLQFLTESVVVSAMGGILGILLGWAATQLLSTLAGWSTSISLSSIGLSFFFSALIGIVFGVYPAQKAAQLNPIDALRY
jgi:macrolide transport system ATP-binding/permease protein